MKRVGAGVLGTGFFAFGVALAVGIVSVGVNAVGWIAIGVNAVGFVALGAVNAMGVFAFGGVNALGGWGAGAVNMGGSRWFGLTASLLAVVGLTAARVRRWPRDDAGLVSLPAALEGGGERARARLVEVGEEIVVRAGATVGRARASGELRAHCASLGWGAPIVVAFRQTAVPLDDMGYRNPAASFVLELAEVKADPRPTLLATLFGGALGLNLLLAWMGLAAAIVAFAVSR